MMLGLRILTLLCNVSPTAVVTKRDVNSSRNILPFLIAACFLSLHIVESKWRSRTQAFIQLQPSHAPLVVGTGGRSPIATPIRKHKEEAQPSGVNMNVSSVGSKIRAFTRLERLGLTFILLKLAS